MDFDRLGLDARRDFVKWILAGAPNVNPAISKWAQQRMKLGYGWKNCTTLSLWDDMTILAAVIYEDYTGRGISMHVAAEDGKRWLNRAFLRAAFNYPFNELKVDRVTGLVPDSNEAAKKFDEHLGFIREGRIRGGSEDGSDMIVYGMLRKECRFLEMPR